MMGRSRDEELVAGWGLYIKLQFIPMTTNKKTMINNTSDKGFIDRKRAFTIVFNPKYHQ